MADSYSPEPRERLLREVDEAFGGPSFGFSLDFRRLAGFTPALILDIRVPPREPDLRTRGPFRMETNGRTDEVTARRAEYWVLAPGPRSAQAVDAPQVFAAKSDVAETIYKLYFQVPAEGPWGLEVPGLESAAHRIEAQRVGGYSEGGRAFMNTGSEA